MQVFSLQNTIATMHITVFQHKCSIIIKLPQTKGFRKPVLNNTSLPEADRTKTECSCCSIQGATQSSQYIVSVTASVNQLYTGCRCQYSMQDRWLRPCHHGITSTLPGKHAECIGLKEPLCVCRRIRPGWNDIGYLEYSWFLVLHVAKGIPSKLVTMLHCMQRCAQQNVCLQTKVATLFFSQDCCHLAACKYYVLLSHCDTSLSAEIVKCP